MGARGWLVLCSLVPLCEGFALSMHASPVPSSRLGFSFTPGGLLFPYHLGVAKALQEERYLREDVPIAGSSAGALACAVIGCGMEVEEAARGAAEICADCREGGTRYRLKGVVERTLDRMLPEDAHVRLNTREAPVTVAITHLWPLPGGNFVDDFSSRADLIEVLLGSCCVPFWFAKEPALQVRGRATVDGVFSLPRKYFGAPGIPSSERVVRVSVFPSSTISVHSEVPGDIICPDILGRLTAMRFVELLNFALRPGSDEMLEELFHMGYLSGHEWVRRYGEGFLNGPEHLLGSSPALEGSV